MHVGSQQPGVESGWFTALADKQLSRALNAMHENPAHRWTVQALALGYESESAFSTAFKRTLGCSPRQYGQKEGTF